MRTALALVLGILLAGSALAQRGFQGGGGRGFGGIRSGWGHHRIGGFPGGFRGGIGFGRPGFPRHGGIGFGRPGFPRHNFAPGFRSRGFFGFRRPFRHPYAFPTYWGAYGGLGYYGYAAEPLAYPAAYPPPAAPNVIIIMPGQPGPEPISYQRSEPAAPQGIEYPPAAQAPAENQIYFLVPLKDGSVTAAVAYWVEGDVLHYVTTAGVHRQVNIGEVDRPQAEKLNQGRVIPFRLPPAG